MDFIDYQVGTRETDMYPRETALLCKALGLAGEAGEVANKIKKIFRDDGGEVTQEKREAIEKELGGVMWYLAQVADELGTNLNAVARENLEILASRKERGVLSGSGDNR